MGTKNARKKRQCKRKVSYDDVESAQKGIKRIYKLKMKFSKWKLSPYKCCYCGKYHIGHRPIKHALK